MTGDCHAGICGSRGLRRPRPPDPGRSGSAFTLCATTLCAPAWCTSRHSGRTGASGWGAWPRVKFSKTGRTIHYNGKTFPRVGRGEYFESESGECWWFSGPRRDGNDRSGNRSGSSLVEIDEGRAPGVLEGRTRSATARGGARQPRVTALSRSGNGGRATGSPPRRPGISGVTVPVMGTGRAITRRRPRGSGGLRRSSQGRRGERGHQGCAEPSAALESEGSSRTTGVLNAWETEEGSPGRGLGLEVHSVVRSGTFDTGNSSTRRARICGGWLPSAVRPAPGGRGSPAPSRSSPESARACCRETPTVAVRALPLHGQGGKRRARAQSAGGRARRRSARA